MNTYGMELILDLHECDSETFNRKTIDKFFAEACEETGMQKCERFVHYLGTYLVRFILNFIQVLGIFCIAP